MEHGLSLLAISAEEKAKLRAIAKPIFEDIRQELETTAAGHASGSGTPA